VAGSRLVACLMLAMRWSGLGNSSTRNWSLPALARAAANTAALGVQGLRRSVAGWV